MYPPPERQQLESLLLGELEEAGRRLNEASPEQKPEALERFTQALQLFTELVLDGKAPKKAQFA